MNTDHESVLQFVINLSVELARIGSKVENMSAKVDNLARAVEHLTEMKECLVEATGELNSKAQVTEGNADTTAKLLDYILKEIQALKMFKTDVSVVAVQADGLSEEELKQRVANAVNSQRQEGHEVHDGAIRSEESQAGVLRNDSGGEAEGCRGQECEEEACEESQACQKTI